MSIQDLRDYAPGKQKGKGRAQERGAALEAAAGKVSASPASPASLASPAGRGVTAQPCKVGAGAGAGAKKKAPAAAKQPAAKAKVAAKAKAKPAAKPPATTAAAASFLTGSGLFGGGASTTPSWLVPASAPASGALVHGAAHPGTVSVERARTFARLDQLAGHTTTYLQLLELSSYVRFFVLITRGGPGSAVGSSAQRSAYRYSIY